MPSLPDRPKALTDAVQDKILAAMRMGSFFSTACYAAGITPEAVKYWMKLADQGAEHAQVYADFFGRIKEYEAISELEALGRLKEGEQGWQSQGWFLERRFKNRWSQKSKVEVTGSRDLSKLSIEELEALAKGKTKDRG